jgi:hypothetical protein
MSGEAHGGAISIRCEIPKRRVPVGNEDLIDRASTPLMRYRSSSFERFARNLLHRHKNNAKRPLLDRRLFGLITVLGSKVMHFGIIALQLVIIGYFDLFYAVGISPNCRHMIPAKSNGCIADLFI